MPFPRRRRDSEGVELPPPQVGERERPDFVRKLVVGLHAPEDDHPMPFRVVDRGVTVVRARRDAGWSQLGPPRRSVAKGQGPDVAGPIAAEDDQASSYRVEDRAVPGASRWDR